ncbi:sulfide:quinone oxidoreductase, mitochondrial-like [Uloborus diversus]|uniref:sulfide:quinone oxidoreductase, mitochondrial-like n=1 Tax=Uloborus diversus TaxID=327109 RepID=UPI00240A2A02|nr:sulfide:quinone oxidoreductase, mitochondrial-like [Uloborus diversus]
MFLKIILKVRYPPIQPNWMSALFSTSSESNQLQKKIVIAGGGTGGITMAAKLLGIGEKDVTVIEPSEMHYYQPLWTLVGGRKVRLEKSGRSTSSIMPQGANWIQDTIVQLDPTNNSIYTEKYGQIEYSYLIVALGLELAFHKIIGLPEALDTAGVCSNYSHKTVQKTAQALKEFKGGNAIFTQPVNPIKCAGAPQKIAYLSEEYFRKNGKLEGTNIIFNTALGKIFSVPVYGALLEEVAKKKNITVNYLHNLIEVKPESKEAIFQKLDPKGNEVDKQAFKYNMLHITPPMVAASVVRKSILADSSGFMAVNRFTLQSTKFSNIFGIGDCTNLPTSKTAAAVAGQSGILLKNIKLAMDGKEPAYKYDGYTSCPLVTGYKKCVLAEFNYELEPLETLPINQAKERYISYFIKKEILPIVYWNFMLKGKWSGPSTIRKFLHLGMSK